jgi:hypothetical protein
MKTWFLIWTPSLEHRVCIIHEDSRLGGRHSFHGSHAPLPVAAANPPLCARTHLSRFIFFPRTTSPTHPRRQVPRAHQQAIFRIGKLNGIAFPKW